MAQLSYQQGDINARIVTFAAASAGGDTVSPDPAGAVLVKNGGAAAITVTVVVPGNTRFGVAEPDVTSESIPAGGEALIGPLPADLADPTSRLIGLTYSAVASVTVAAVRL